MLKFPPKHLIFYIKNAGNFHYKSLFKPGNLPLTREAPIMLRESLDELRAGVAEVGEEHLAETADVQCGGALRLQLPQVVADDRAAVVQEQLTCLQV